MAPAPLTPADVLARLAEARPELAAAFSGFSDAQWNWSPDPSRWSVAQVAEHVATVDRGTAALLTTRFDTMTPADYTPEQRGKKDAQVLAVVTDRSFKIEAPAMVAPKGRYATRAEAEAALMANRDAIGEAVTARGDTLRTRTFPHPALGALDGLQWVLMSIQHARRHLLQVQELRAHPDFPRS